MEIEITHDTEELIVQGSLLSSIEMMTDNINTLCEHEKLADYQLEDLRNDMQTLTSAIEMYKYYTPQVDWDALDQFDVNLEEAMRLMVTTTTTESSLGIDEGSL